MIITSSMVHVAIVQIMTLINLFLLKTGLQIANLLNSLLSLSVIDQFTMEH